jgi:protease-4
MSFQPLSSMRRGVGALWRGLDATRRFVLNLIFLIIVIALVWSLFGGGLKPLLPKTALVLDLKGELVEERAGSVRDSVVAGLSGNGRRLVRLPDVLKALDGAA